MKIHANECRLATEVSPPAAVLVVILSVELAVAEPVDAMNEPALVAKQHVHFYINCKRALIHLLDVARVMTDDDDGPTFANRYLSMQLSILPVTG